MTRINHHHYSRLRANANGQGDPPPRLRPWLMGFLAIALVGGVAFMLIGTGAAFAFYRSYTKDLVAPQALIANLPSGSIRFYDHNGNLLYEDLGPLEALRNPVPLSEISPWLVRATVSTEDDGFYDNPGINIRGLLRAAYENLLPGSGDGFFKGSGGSSITQQLVKNIYIPLEERSDRSITRKLREVALAIELTRQFSKDQILEWYLNQIFYGNLAYGAEAAAQRYFNKPAKELTLAEAALLAGIPKAPAHYDPTRSEENRERALERQHDVLDLMAKHGYVSPGEAAAATQEELVFAEPHFSIEAPHFVFYLWDQGQGTG
ncbi:MAG TPA: transglycosylase domain-containing protein, partial [Dehalococcoidia bacterium]|nr:transglycosylase domain-containing protein [Dehalococcoidia bacterium]